MRLVRYLLVLPILVAAPMAGAGAGDPLRTTSQVPFGVAEKSSAWVAIDEVTTGTLTRFFPVFAAGPKWSSSAIKGTKPYAVDTKDPDVEAKMREKSESARKATDATLEAKGAAETTPLSGAITARYRVAEWDSVILLEKDQVIMRTGEAGETKTAPIGPALAKLLPRKCKGKLEGKLLHVAAQVAWKSVAAYVEVQCTPDDEKDGGIRVRKLIAADVTKVIAH